MAITPDGTKAYVVNGNSGTVSVIDTATNTVGATVTVGTAPYGVAITPDGTSAYVTNDGSNTVSVIDTATNTVSATVTVGTLPTGWPSPPTGPRPTWRIHFGHRERHRHRHQHGQRHRDGGHTPLRSSHHP